jgi:hypothetical protein
MLLINFKLDIECLHSFALCLPFCLLGPFQILILLFRMIKGYHTIQFFVKYLAKNHVVQHYTH